MKFTYQGHPLGMAAADTTPPQHPLRFPFIPVARRALHCVHRSVRNCRLTEMDGAGGTL